MTERNWAGNHRYRAERIHRPGTLDELRALVSAASELRVLGSRHSFSDIGDARELVSLAAMPSDVRVDREAGTVSLGAGTTYAELAQALAPHGLALGNLASLPHITVGGSVATASHGSGDRSGNLATAVAALELVAAGGDVVTAARGDADFDGMVVGLGALGVVARLTLDVEPAYEVRQRVFEGLAWEALDEHLDALMAAGDSVSAFTRLGAEVDQVWVKTRVGAAPERVRPDLLGARAATEERHPILGVDPVHATAQLGRPGPWWDRLPHFRAGFRPSQGEELQSEYLVARADAVAAIRAVRERSGRIRPLLHVCEIRTVAADRLWLSPQYGRATAGIHFTWKREPAAVLRVLEHVEAALEPFRPRPHWGKLFLAGADTLADRYERLADFAALAGRLDPHGVFRNDWLRTRLLS